MAIRIESPQGEEALSEFVLFQDRVYTYRSARWPAMLPLYLPILIGQSPFAHERTLRPFVARQGGEIVARALAVIDEPYQRHWHEKLGHIVMFEAMPDSNAAVTQMMDAACTWLGERGAVDARAGMGLLEFPFVIDDYETLPPSVLRQNPPYYHTLLKEAAFELEKGLVDYRIEVTPELMERWQSALEAARRGGFRIVQVKDLELKRAVADFTPTWNEAFARHWGATPFSTDELEMLFTFFQFAGGLDTSIIAYRGEEPVGCLLVAPDSPEGALLAPGRVLKDCEKVNFLGIGVRESARGRGVNLAMAACSFLEMVRRGQKFISYTLVLDDNWPSRRTALKLGATVCANYVAYRRYFNRR